MSFRAVAKQHFPARTVFCCWRSEVCLFGSGLRQLLCTLEKYCAFDILVFTIMGLAILRLLPF